MFGKDNRIQLPPRTDFHARMEEWKSTFRGVSSTGHSVAPCQDKNTERTRLQNGAVEVLFKEKRLIVEWGTGTGKSRVGVEAARKVLSSGGSRILLLVGETTHKANWQQEFKDSLGETEGAAVFSRITVECYQSLMKYEGTSWNLVIADEAHHLRSALRQNALRSLNAEMFLCLSATLSDKGDGEELIETLEETFGPFESLKYTTQDSIDSGIIGIPIIHVHLLSLDRISSMQTVDIDRGGSKGRWEVTCSLSELPVVIGAKGSYIAHVNCTAREGYGLLCDEIKRMKTRKDSLVDKMWTAGADTAGLSRQNEFLSNKIANYGGRRKMFMGECKTKFAEGLIKALGNKRFVCFCSSVKQGEDLGGEFAINSHKKDNDDVIIGFNKGNHGQIYAVGMIREGQNLKGIQAGIIIQLGGKGRTFIQEFGRVLRAEKPEQHVIVIDGTKDVDYFFESLDGINPQYVKVHDYTAAPKNSSREVIQQSASPAVARRFGISYIPAFGDRELAV